MKQQQKAQAVAQSSQSAGDKSGAASPAGTGAAKGSRTLAERLDKAQTPERTAETPPAAAKPASAGERSSAGQSADRREAQPARSHIAANDDLPSIGGLIYALQQRPSRSPFLFALAASFVWLILGGGAGWALLSANVPEASGVGSLVQHPSALVVAATIIVPIALFWFLALLIWRAQELRLMASAMTEVAIRLAEPDKLAEQSVASLGQTIRRQVAAMNDAISRALGRAGELEAMVHNEVAALENSYGENELRVRRLIEELSSEREALANNSERVSEALRGVGSQVSKDINSASDQATKSLVTATSSIAESLTAKSGKITAAMTAAGTAIDNKLAERGVRVAEALQETSRKAGEAMDVKANSLIQSMTTVSSRLSKDVPELLEKMDSEQQRLNTIIVSANENFGALETAISQRTTQLDTTLQQRGQEMKTALSSTTAALDTTLKQRGQEINTALSNSKAEMDLALQKKTEELKASLAERIQALDETVSSQAKAISQSLNKSTMTMNQVLAEGADSLKRSSVQMSEDSQKATRDLNTQAQTLKDVSSGMLNQIHSLTQRFEKQGQAIMTASQALDSSNARIDSILERRHSEISGLLETVSSKAQALDKMMRSYTGIIESSLVQVEARAKELSITLAQESSNQSRATIQEIERLRADTQAHTQQAVQELQTNFQSITHQVAEQLGALTREFGKTTREMRGTANQTAGEIETTRQELRRRMRDLPTETRQNTEAMRKAVSDQLKALGVLSAIASEHKNTDSVAPAASRMPAIPSPPPPGAPHPSSYGAPAGYGAPYGGAQIQYGANQLPAAPAPSDSPQPSHFTGDQQPAYSGYEQASRDRDDLASVTSGLASQLTGSGPVPAPGGNQPRNQGGGVRITGGPPPEPESAHREGWSVGDLLARASAQTDTTRLYASQPQTQDMAPSSEPSPAASSAADLRLTDLARAIDHRTAAEIWQRFQRGEREVFSRQHYTQEGQTAFDEILARYQRDSDFRETVNRYIGDFERLLSEAESKGQDPAVVQNYLTSETGRVYLMLAHASGRLR